ncbi:DUF4232 domain-containing protein [Streptomyces endophytica]|uniref:DUF4232 domain-containing protein n=1 Tax=Streptomyces endophytica TaxID=2991496 RepID=A0ABY6PIX7_9ACTN|nr:DUF4232 domain-containing protein [Streptomyces endophytica]UZJ33310.1 DUF4232 domain-containing protein [Streptomyces endophytica]
MRRRSLLAATSAALVLTVSAGLGLTGCGSPRMAALHANCTTKGLRWKLTVLKKPAHGTHRDARLTIVNKTARPCVFGGYPLFEVHVGKGPMADGKGRGAVPPPIDLRAGGTVTTALRYQDAWPGEPSGQCLVSNMEATVAAPHDRALRSITARDESGRRSLLNVCNDTVWMSPPKEAAE